MKLKKKIEIPLDEYIYLSLYDRKNGYYMKKNPFGKKGDFITAPNISSLFSEMIAIWIISFWQSLGSHKKISKKTGLISSLFLIFYSIFRFFIEFTRAPDSHLGLIFINFSMGQIMSVIFFLSGLYLFYRQNDFKK